MGPACSDNLLCCDFCGRTRRDGRTRTLKSGKPRPGYHAVVVRNGETRHILRMSDVRPDDATLYYARRAKFEVRRMRCPYNWCRAWATCTDCRLEGRHRSAGCVNTRAGDGNTHRKICKEASRMSAEGKKFPEICARVAELAGVAVQ